MSELSKQALKVENNSSFPNNNSGLITPQILRDFNVDMIDSLVDQIGYNVASASWNQQIDALEVFSGSTDVSISNLNQLSASQQVSINNINAFTASATGLSTGSLLVTASAVSNVITFTKGDASTFDVTVADTTDLSKLNQATASLQAFTASATISINNLNTTTASVNVSITNLNASSASQQVSINNLNTTSASVNVSITNLNASSASQQVSINSLNAKTGSYATTGSNTFTGNQTINADLTISSSQQLKFGAVGSIRDAGNGITVFDTSGGYQHRNFTSGEYQFEQNANSGMFFYNRVAGIVISGSSTQIQDVDFIPFSASLDSRINTLSAETGSYITETESGSFLITASFASQTLTFTKGDNTTFSVTIPSCVRVRPLLPCILFQVFLHSIRFHKY